MKKVLIVFTFLLSSQIGITQPNCLLLKDSVCIKACELSDEAAKYQGSRYSQELFDQAIELCPSFAYAYYEKSVPYLKQGLMKEWKILIDKAVELEPKTYLLNRGCNQIQFFRNYENGLKDLNRLYELLGYFDIGYTNSGEYHVQMIRAISYRKLNKVDKSIEIMEELINGKNYHQGLFDFFHIGISYLEADRLQEAKKAFDKQNQENELAETYYYYSQIYKKQNQIIDSEKMLIKAKELYTNGKTMTNNYYHYLDKVFYADIENELNKLK